MNPYEKLNVPTDASEADIKKAYRRKAQDHHPDKPDGSEDEFHAIKLAYDVLSDPERRRKFDEFGDTDEAPKGNIAEQMVVNAFNVLIDEDDLKGNIIERVVGRINQEKEKVNREMVKANHKLSKLESRKSRITAKDNNLFEGLLDQKITGINHGLEQAKELIVNLEKAVLILENYEDTAPEIITETRFHTQTSQLGGFGTGQNFFRT